MARKHKLIGAVITAVFLAIVGYVVVVFNY
jgi:hypothetical protein